MLKLKLQYFGHLMSRADSLEKYTKKEDQWALNDGGIKEKEGWWKLPDQRLAVPSNHAVQHRAQGKLNT